MEWSGPIPAATVILTRQGAAVPEFYLVQRRSGNGFMAGNYVFPGGRVDAGDHDTAFWTGVSDLEPAAVAARLGGGLGWASALSYAVAAIRETFEEAGVFLGQPGDTDGHRALPDRPQAARLPRGWLAEAAKRGCRLALSSLCRWAWWVTPPGMKARFDTRFFLAIMPSGQSGSPDHREVVAGGWFTAEAALASNLAGELPLSPPTLVTLNELLPYNDVGSIVSDAATRAWGEAIGPRFVQLPNGALILEPWDPEHAGTAAPTVPERFDEAVVPAGQAFSRLWYDGRIWRPVRVDHFT
jgi:8-oxo-dGTP pyrophosphatase MutT (NUDIX family)